MKTSSNLRSIGMHFIVLTVTALFVGLTVGPREAIALCVGGVVSLIILVGTIWSTSQIFTETFQEKPIALTSLIIVVKYALIGSILFYTVQYTAFSVLWLGLGIGLILPTLSISGLMSNQDPSRDDGK